MYKKHYIEKKNEKRCKMIFFPVMLNLFNPIMTFFKHIRPITDSEKNSGCNDRSNYW